MNVKYLGDALDHWKGALFAHLVEHHRLSNLVAYPMATDWEAWTDDDYRLYARLLRIAPHAVSRSTLQLTSRSRDFVSADRSSDVFLDPNTGIATAGVRNREDYALVEDVCGLLASGDDR